MGRPAPILRTDAVGPSLGLKSRKLTFCNIAQQTKNLHVWNIAFDVFADGDMRGKNSPSDVCCPPRAIICGI